MVAGSVDHSLALSKGGTVGACGFNTYGQLGLGDTDQRDTFTAVGRWVKAAMTLHGAFPPQR